MHSPTLLKEICEIKLVLDLGDPKEAQKLFIEIDKRIDLICLISKLDKARVIRVVTHHYKEYVVKRHADGLLGKSQQATMLEIPILPME